MMRRSASAKDHLHHPRGKHGREGRRSLNKFLESPELPAAARNFRPPEPPAVPELLARRIEAVRECANSLDSPDLGRTFSWNLRRPDLPVVPGTSGPACAQTLGSKPMYPFAPHLPLRGPRLYILLHLLISRVSVVIAHLRDRATLIHYGSTPRERPRPLYGEDPLGFKTPSWVAPSRPPHGEEPVTLCIVPC